ncbi:MAG: hypothetical protein ACYSOD_02995 [Planctomycetota bacterium]|jgi:hypothetical protein
MKKGYNPEKYVIQSISGHFNGFSKKIMTLPGLGTETALVFSVKNSNTNDSYSYGKLK